MIIKEHITIEDYKATHARLQQIIIDQVDEIDRLRSLIVELFKASIKE